MYCNENTKSIDRRISVALGTEIMLSVSQSCRMEGKCNVTGIQTVMVEVCVEMGMEIILIVGQSFRMEGKCIVTRIQRVMIDV